MTQYINYGYARVADCELAKKHSSPEESTPFATRTANTGLSEGFGLKSPLFLNSASLI